MYFRPLSILTCFADFKKLSERFSEEGQLRNLMHTVTTKDVLRKSPVQSAPTDLEALKVIYKEELKSTACDGKYSGTTFYSISFSTSTAGLQGAAHLEQCFGTICNGGHTLLWNSS